MFELLNEMEEILAESIKYQEKCGFTITSNVPDLVVHKLTKKINQLQNLGVVEKNKQSICEYLDIALRSYPLLVNETNRQMVSEAISDFANNNDQSLMELDITNPDHRQQIKNYAVEILKRHPDCDVHEALACAMKDCEPGDCEINDQYFAHVEQHFNEEDIEEVMNRARGNMDT